METDYHTPRSFGVVRARCLRFFVCYVGDEFGWVYREGVLLLNFGREFFSLSGWIGEDGISDIGVNMMFEALVEEGMFYLVCVNVL